jgi:hypothetical protein
MANLNTSISPSPVVTSLTKGRVTASGYTGNVTVSLGVNPSLATLAGTLTQPSVAGVATFNDLTLNRSGIGFTLVATGAAQGGVTPRPVTSRPFNIPTQLVFTTQPTSVAAPDDILPLFVVTARDSAGNTDTSYNGEVTVSLYTGAALGILSGIFTRNAISGVANFSGLSIDETGTYSLRAEGGASTIAATPSPKVSSTFVVGPAIALTAQEDAGTFGFIKDNFGPGMDLGAVSPATFLSKNILVLDGTTSLTRTMFMTDPGLTQDAFTSITVGSTTLLSSAATFDDGGGTYSLWTWAPNSQLFTAATAYTVLITI